MIKLKPLIINLLIPLCVGGAAAFFTRGTMDIYESVRQPPLSPPGWAFPVVWTALYILMGVAAYLVWMRDSTGRTGALFVYGVQLAFNFAWPLIFFKAQNFEVGFFWLVALWFFVLLTIVWFFAEKKAAGALMIPYIIWVSFAAYLNLGVWVLNI